MRLVVEHEDVGRRPLLCISGRLVHLNRADFEKWFTERFVDGNEGRSQPARSFEELSAADPELFCSNLGQLLDPILDVLLLPRLRMRHILAVRDHPGRNRGLKRLGFCRRALAKLFVAQPCVLFAGAGISL